MENSESLRDYYKFINKEIPEDLQYKTNSARHFNVFKCYRDLNTIFPFVRRDYYGICLLNLKALIQTNDQTIRVDRPFIFYSSPEIKWGWETISDDQEGFICVFNEGYLTKELKSALRKLNNLFKSNTNPYILLEQSDYDLLFLYFKQIHEEHHGDFGHKNRVIQNLLQLIVYLGIKLLNAKTTDLEYFTTKDRVCLRFFNLLEAQFPVYSPRNPIQCRTPSDFANSLHMHVNHLNHSLKLQTGKSTGEVIDKRMIAEAMDLLENSDWSVTEIAQALGFEYLQHFSYFFKKNVGVTPKFHRNSFLKNI